MKHRQEPKSVHPHLPARGLGRRQSKPNTGGGLCLETTAVPSQIFCWQERLTGSEHAQGGSPLTQWLSVAARKGASMKANGETRREFVFYLLPEFTLLALASAVEALRLANAILEYDAYAWRLVSGDGISAEASCGISLKCDSTIEAERLAVGSRDRPFMVVVCGGRNVERYASKTGEAWLRECRQNAIAIASLCTGAYVLAQARLLDDKRCVIHWENYPSFTERIRRHGGADGPLRDRRCHPHLRRRCRVLRYDASPDWQRFRRDGGLRRLRAGDRRPHPQFRGPPADAVLATRGEAPSRRRALDRTDAGTLADPVPVEALMADIGLTRRQTERLFRNELGQSPGKFYIESSAGAREAAPATDEKADRRRGDCLRLLVGLALLEELSRRLRAFPARGTCAETHGPTGKDQREGIPRVSARGGPSTERERRKHRRPKTTGPRADAVRPWGAIHAPQEERRLDRHCC